MSDSACVDCVMAIANADTSGISDVEAWQQRIDSRGGLVGWVVACNEDCEGWFSWSACDVCGSNLGGERHPVVKL